MDTTPNFSQLRRLALQQGLLLVKSGQRDPAADDYGLYALLIDSKESRSDKRGGQNGAAAFASGAGMTLEEIAEHLG